MQPAQFLLQLYQTFIIQGEQNALDSVYEFIDQHLRINDFNTVNYLLYNINIKQVNVNIAVGFLATTHGSIECKPAREKLADEIIQYYGTELEPRSITYINSLKNGS